MEVRFLIDIGAKIRTLRLKNDLTLADLASRCELTVGFLSQLENNVSSPSIATLSDVLEALGSNLSEFFQPEKNQKKVFKEEDYFEKITDEYILNWLVPDAQKRNMEALHLELKSGCKSQIIGPHHGEEFGYVLEGAIYLIYGKEKNLVEQGQTFYIEGNRTHYLLNESKKTAKIIWISNPPSF